MLCELGISADRIVTCLLLLLLLFICQEAQEYAQDNGLLFMETSAKTAMNVNEIFLAIGKLLHI